MVPTLRVNIDTILAFGYPPAARANHRDFGFSGDAPRHGQEITGRRLEAFCSAVDSLARIQIAVSDANADRSIAL